MAGSDLVSADLETSGDELPTADPAPEVAAVPASEGGPSGLAIAAIVAAVVALGVAGMSLGIAIGRKRGPVNRLSYPASR